MLSLGYQQLQGEQNIFYLSECPVESAQSQCDKHVVKMILESAQMLCTAHHACPSDAERPRSSTSKHTNARPPLGSQPGNYG